MNPEQQSAVHADLNRPLCVVAGPGSGKTFTLIERIKYIARTDQQARVLVLAFSKSAVTEMQTRLATEGCDIQRVSVMTFHSFGFKIAMNLYKYMGFARPPGKCSSKQSVDALKEALDQAPDLLLAYSASENKAGFLRRLLKLIHFAKCKPNPSAYLIQNGSHDPSECRQIVRVFQAYQQKLKDRAIVDFPDMVNLPYTLFAQSMSQQTQLNAPSQSSHSHSIYAGQVGGNPLDWVQQQYQYAVVDEFQDLNGVQLQLLLQVAVHGRVTVVGDFDQVCDLKIMLIIDDEVNTCRLFW